MFVCTLLKSLHTVDISPLSKERNE